MSDWKNRLGVMYSTNPDFQYEHEDSEEVTETLPPEKQRLRITLDRKQRRGKEVTLVSGYIGSTDDLTDLSRLLKQRCGVGGAAKDGEIIIQGNQVEKVKEILRSLHYGVK
ncbi:putative translation initiation factor SUI1 [Porphyromonas gingivalis F0185]|uniref:translation initiation factor n=1 Tax=Porphyromonas gingivalis TaxID=837 RepID=UPI0003AD5A9F|nr:translation initiation factor [Porphyromonas gingivalis]ERJ85876.1 putative translation initiation factor SUI1 [Porphyromonas gingivalis F0185]